MNLMTCGRPDIVNKLESVDRFNVVISFQICDNFSKIVMFFIFYFVN